MNIAIRADGGHDIGMGHIMRCIALAQALRENGCSVYFITWPDHAVEASIKKHLHDSVGIIDIERRSYIAGELEQLDAIVRRHAIDALVVDSYEADQDYLVKVKKIVRCSVVIDDLNRFAFPSDIVINGNVYAPQMEYKSIYGNTKFLLGPKYLLMRKEFSNLPKRCVKDKVERILVTMGGSDIMGITVKILRALRNAEIKVDIDIVMGAAFKNKDAIEAVTSAMPNVRLLYDIEDMAELMLKADMAISAAGSTLYELAACGVPTIALIQADNQVLAAESMAKAGCIMNLGWGDKVDEKIMAKATVELAHDYYRRNSMSNIGQSLIDGFGAARCAHELISHDKIGR